MVNMNTLMKKKLPPDQNKLTERATFTYSSLRKAFEEQPKMNEDQREKRRLTIVRISY